MTQSYTSRLSTLDFKLGHTACSVQATISVQVISVPRPDGFHGRFAAVAGLDEEFVLLDSEDENVPISGDEIRLSRCVATVEFSKMLEISVKAWQGGRVFRCGMHFAPQEMGTDFQTTDIGFCRIKVTVYWSLFP
ncbi:hypothetical protein HU200_032173 [Digitaria exilis]|uniref:DUF6598 domain-containing protein n=1 Tax=Digitaria exilis TaxID=1010633 RepID=A0A835BNT7_9POAL|nr:hypothetical protein HU200_032173 [Digitaria exilis]